MGTVMCDSRLQAILLLCAAVSVSAELLVEDPDGEGAKVDAQRGQMEPVMVEVQRPSREEPRVEGRIVKTMTSPSQDSFHSWQMKAMIDENLSKEAQNTDLRKVFRALGAIIAEDE